MFACCAPRSSPLQRPEQRVVANETLTYLMDGAKPISAWHDVPLRAGNHPVTGAPLFHFVCEIPAGTTPKYEISTSKPLNPIVVDRNKKDGSPRCVQYALLWLSAACCLSRSPVHPPLALTSRATAIHRRCSHYAFRSLINYGALPQTWENPEHVDEWTKEKGDGDPVDVCEIGSAVSGAGKAAGSSAATAATGSVYRVQIIGALAMLDGGETDWKLIGIRDTDPLASKLTCVSQLAAGGSGLSPVTAASVKTLLDDVRHWFRTYKVPDGKPENEFAFNGQFLDAVTALKIVDSTNKQWSELVASRLSRQWAYGYAALSKAKVWTPPADWAPPATAPAKLQ